jgi:Uri superfamily endonuclease
MEGSYVLLLELNKNRTINAGGLGKIKFRKGFYAYVGSALGGIEKRVERHLMVEAGLEHKLHWHIDYLLENAKISEIISVENPDRKECGIAKKLAEKFPSVKGFGCSDCKCDSHLFYSKTLKDFKKEISDIVEKV